MIQLICLILPSLIGVQWLFFLEKQHPRALEVLLKGALFSIFGNAGTLFVLKLIGRSGRLINEELFTIGFSYQYLIVSTGIILILATLFFLVRKVIVLELEVRKKDEKA